MATPQPIGRIMLKDVRLSFPALFKPEAYQPGDAEKYKATLLVPKDSKQAKEIDAKILAVLKDKFGTKADSVLKTIRGNANKFAWQDGDNKEYDGYAGMMALSAKSDARPTVLDQDKSPLTAADGKPYAGCYVNASIDLFAYTTGGNGLSASLRGVQFVRDGDSFSGARPADSDEFEAVEGEAPEMDMA